MNTIKKALAWAFAWLRGERSVLRDLVIAAIAIGIFQSVLWVTTKFGIGVVYADYLHTISWVFYCSLIAWVGLRVAFRNTAGSYFGKQMDVDWATASPNVKIIVTVAIFLGFLFAGVLVSKGSGHRKGVPKPPKIDAVTENVALPISYETRDMIIYYEVGGRSGYSSVPEVPAYRTTASGVTVGFGTDCGHMSKAQIQEAFEGIIPQKMINALKLTSGKKGRDAYYNGLPLVKHTVRISWDQAVKVFERYTLPRFTLLTKNAFGLSRNQLHPHENGALTSLVFNRGSSMSGNRRRHMRYVRDDIPEGENVPRIFMDMREIWNYNQLRGLWLRRESESQWFQKGLRIRLGCHRASTYLLEPTPAYLVMPRLSPAPPCRSLAA